MSELTNPSLNKAKRPWWNKISQNPVTLKELRGRMRGPRAFIILTSYLFLMGAFVFMIYAIVAVDQSASSSSNRLAGQSIFYTLVSIQAFLVIFISPAFTSGAISGERERQTYDLLRTTLLSPRAFILGKLLSAMSYVFLLILAAIPVISMAFMLGGVTLLEVIISQVLLVAAAITYAMMGLYYSGRMRSTLAASVVTYATALGLTIGTPIIAFFTTLLLEGFFFNSSNETAQAVIVYIGLIISTTNLPATLIISEAFFQDGNSWWGYLTTSPTVWFFSPWYVFLVVHGLYTYWLYRATLRRVSAISNT